ncbi:MAG TPA: hypothetical protein VFF23_06075 [Hanamia sp.]|jgi:hypothetical protein|nr:hypothetical protein [Hanamia sp.]
MRDTGQGEGFITDQVLVITPVMQNTESFRASPLQRGLVEGKY